LNKTFVSLAEACQWVDQAVQKYNHIRPHASCDYLTPERAHEQNGLLKKRWRNKVYAQKPLQEQTSNKKDT